jgi:ABC-type branched-subunit amino acid transport system substrate-binding protein
VIVAAVTLIGSRAFAQDPGVTPDTILLGSHQPLSGPAATFSVIARTSEAYFRMINEQGGVHGRRIVYRYEDDSYSPPRAVEVVRKLVERDRVFAIFSGVGTAPHTAVYRDLLERRVPDMYVATGATKWAFPPENGFKPYPTLFGFPPTYLTEGSVLGRFAIEKWPGKKAAVLYQNDDFGKDGAAAFAQTVRGRLPLVSEDAYETTTVSLDAQLLTAKERGAEVVYVVALPKFAGMYLKRAWELGWKPVFLITYASSSGVTWKLAGPDCDPLASRTACGASDGAITSTYLPAPEDMDNPKVARHRRILDTYAGGLKADLSTIYGQAAAELMVETLRRAGPHLTRESLIRAAESITGWSDGLATNVTMGPDDHAPIEDLKVVEIRHGRFDRELTGWIPGSRPTK